MCCKNIIIAALANIFLASSVLGSTPAWDMTYGRKKDESSASVQQTSDGGYIIAETSSSYGAGGTDVWLSYVLDGASSIDSSATANKSIQGFDILINAVGLLIAMYMATKIKNRHFLNDDYEYNYIFFKR